MPALAHGQLTLEPTLTFLVSAIQAAKRDGDYRCAALSLGALAHMELMNGALRPAMRAAALAIEFMLHAARSSESLTAGQQLYHETLAELIKLRNSIQSAKEQATL